MREKNKIKKESSYLNINDFDDNRFETTIKKIGLVQLILEISKTIKLLKSGFSKKKKNTE